MHARVLPAAALIATMLSVTPLAHAEHNQPPEGFTALFDGKTLDGWWGWGTKHYNEYINLDAEALEELQAKSLADIEKYWSVENGELVAHDRHRLLRGLPGNEAQKDHAAGVLARDGLGLFLTTKEFFGDFELHVEYKTVAMADSGIYLRGCPQVQIWDTTEEGGKWGARGGQGLRRVVEQQEGLEGQGPARAGGQAVRRVEQLPHHHGRGHRDRLSQRQARR